MSRKVYVDVEVRLILNLDDNIEVSKAIYMLKIDAGDNDFDIEDYEIVDYEITDSK